MSALYIEQNDYSEMAPISIFFLTNTVKQSFSTCQNNSGDYDGWMPKWIFPFKKLYVS